MLLEYMEDVDDKLFKEYSKGKTFINKFDHEQMKKIKKKQLKN